MVVRESLPVGPGELTQTEIGEYVRSKEIECLASLRSSERFRAATTSQFLDEEEPILPSIAKRPVSLKLASGLYSVTRVVTDQGMERSFCIDLTDTNGHHKIYQLGQSRTDKWDRDNDPFDPANPDAFVASFGNEESGEEEAPLFTYGVYVTEFETGEDSSVPTTLSNNQEAIDRFNSFFEVFTAELAT
ncbi:MAG TPA: hypothetical protein VIH90_07150 [Candidatus Saccharimonadales bacterium]